MQTIGLGDPLRAVSGRDSALQTIRWRHTTDQVARQTERFSTVLRMSVNASEHAHFRLPVGLLLDDFDERDSNVDQARRIRRAPL